MKIQHFILVMALLLAANVSAATRIRLTSAADSLNYSLGLIHGIDKRKPILDEYHGKAKALSCFVNGFEKAFYLKEGSSEYFFHLGFHAGGQFARECATNEHFFGDSSFHSEMTLIAEGFRAGLSGSYFPISSAECQNFVKQHLVGRYLSESDDTPATLSAAQSDTMNMCIGYISGSQSRMAILRGDSAPENVKIFIEGFDKGIMVRSSSYPELDGMDIAFNFSHQLDCMPFFVDDERLPVFKNIIDRGFTDGMLYNGKKAKCLMSKDEAMHFADSVIGLATERRAVRLKAAADSFLVENGKRPDVSVTASGLQFQVINEAEGPKPADADTVTAYFVGTFTDGTVFDSSYDYGNPDRYVINSMLPGLVEGVQLMSKGAKYRFFIPYNLAYGEEGVNDIPPYSVLVFDVDLIDFNPAKNEQDE